jgi:hypothetical protein
MEFLALIFYHFHYSPKKCILQSSSWNALLLISLFSHHSLLLSIICCYGINVFFLQCLPLIRFWFYVASAHNVITSTYTVLCLSLFLSVLATIATWSKAWTVFARSDAGIVGSNPTQGMHVWCVCVCVCVCSVFVPCDRLITRPRSPSNCEKWLWNLIRGLGPELAGRAIEKIILLLLFIYHSINPKGGYRICHNIYKYKLNHKHVEQYRK